MKNLHKTLSEPRFKLETKDKEPLLETVKENNTINHLLTNNRILITNKENYTKKHTVYEKESGNI